MGSTQGQGPHPPSVHHGMEPQPHTPTRAFASDRQDCFGSSLLHPIAPPTDSDGVVMKGQILLICVTRSHGRIQDLARAWVTPLRLGRGLLAKKKAIFT